MCCLCVVCVTFECCVFGLQVDNGVLFDVTCLLFGGVCCVFVLLVVCFLVFCLLFVVGCWFLLVVCCLLFDVIDFVFEFHCSVSVACLFGVCRASCVDCRLMFVV